MYTNVSEQFKNIVKSNVITSTARLTFKNFFPNTDNPNLVIEKENITNNDIGLTDCCYHDGQLIGTAMLRELEIEIKNTLNYDLADRYFDLEIGILVDNENLTYEYVPFGEFLVVSYEDLKSSNKCRLIANDLMVKLNAPYIENMNFNPTLPITLKKFYTDFMSSYGIECEEQTLPNENFMILALPNFEGYTGRQVLMKISELFGSFAKINRNNKCQMYLKTETDEKIDATQMNKKLEIDKRYGPVNVVTVGLSSVEGENVTLRDEDSITEYGETTIRIDDNPFVYSEELRELVINELYDRLVGFSYIPVSFKYKALLYTDCGDRVQVQNVQTGEYVDTIILNQYTKIPRTRQSSIETKALTNTSQKLKYISKSKQDRTRAEIMVKKHELEIQSIVGQIGDRKNKETTVTQDIDSINSKVSNIADVTNTVQGITKIEIEDAVEGDLLELHIIGNNTVFLPLYPSDELYPSDSLVPNDGQSILRVTHYDKEENEIVDEYDLKVPEVLRQKGAVYDEYIYERGSSKVIRRISSAGNIMGDPIEESLGELTIKLGQGRNIIELLYYAANMTVRYAMQNEYTDIFATKAEMSTTIEQTAQEINLEVSKKVDETEIISKINMSSEEIKILAKMLNLEGYVTINETFKIDENGSIECVGGSVGGFTIDRNAIYSDAVGVISSPSDFSGYAFWAGANTTNIGGAPYRVKEDGTVYALGGVIIQNDSQYTNSSLSGVTTNGTMTATSFVNASERKLKANIKKFSKSALDIIKNAEIYSYNYKRKKQKKIGFVIGEGYSTPEELITTDGDGETQGVDLYNAISLCMKGLQEVCEKIEN